MIKFVLMVRVNYIFLAILRQLLRTCHGISGYLEPLRVGQRQDLDAVQVHDLRDVPSIEYLSRQRFIKVVDAKI